MTKKISNNLDPDEEVIFEEDQVDQNIALKLKKLNDKIKSLEGEKMENLLGWQRAKADYSNLKINTEKEKAELGGMIKGGIIMDLLPLADSFEIAMANKAVWEEVPENWRKGVEYIYNHLENILSNHGVSVIKEVGLPFNPLEHETIGLVDTENKAEDHTVLEVVKKGYRLGDRVIRPAQVKIGNLVDKN